MSNILCVGAGAVGRGLIVPLLQKHRVVLYDTKVDLRQDTEVCRYPMIDAPGAEWQWVNYVTFRGLELFDTAFVAVRVENLPSVGKWLMRHYAHFTTGAQIVVCENTPDSAGKLRDAIQIDFPRWNFVNAIAECIVPEPTAEMKAAHPLLTYHDPRGYLVVDAKAWHREWIIGPTYSDNFALAWDLKWYCHCALHALVAYLGIEKGHTYIHEAIDDEEIADAVGRVMWNAVAELIAKYPIEHEVIGERLLRELDVLRDATRPDPLVRVARDAARKVQPGERLDSLRQLVGGSETVERAMRVAKEMA